MILAGHQRCNKSGPKTIKTLSQHLSLDRIGLIAENPDYAPIVINGHLVIEGLMVGLICDGCIVKLKNGRNSGLWRG